MQIGGVDLRLMQPIRSRVRWIGQRELVEQILACWTTVTAADLPLTPRLVGKPGMGKTTLARAAAQELGRPIHILQCTMDTRAEDLLVTPVIGAGGGIRYHASPLVSAMLTGGIAILDEANRMPEKSWASLAPLLDERRFADSVIAGARIEARPEFRCCVTMNDDSSTYEIPEYIRSRLQPLIAVDYPSADEELEILRYNVDFAPADLLRMCADLLQESHRYRLDYSTRDGIHIMRYAVKLERTRGLERGQAFDLAVRQVLGEGARDFERRAREALIADNMIDFRGLFGEIAGEEQSDGRGEEP